MSKPLTRSLVRLFSIATLLAASTLLVTSDGLSQQRAERREATPASQTERATIAPGTSAPTIGDADLTLSGDVHLDDTSTVFKDGTLFLWDDASTLALGRGALSANSTGLGNLAIGLDALLNNTLGSRNTAIGFQALRSDASHPSGIDNTAVGYKALYANQAYYSVELTNFYGYHNTAVGSSALRSNTIGTDNTAVGSQTLYNLTIGRQNTAVGNTALFGATTANKNTAIGEDAMIHTSDGSGNVAVGENAMYYNLSGSQNVAVGQNALYFFEIGCCNIAIGTGALEATTTGSFNTAVGDDALAGLNGSYDNNIAIGSGAGTAAIHNDNILIGHNGAAGDEGRIRIGDEDQLATYIAGIYPVTGGTHYALVDSYGQLSRGGAVASSARFKSAIRDMGGASRGLFSLRPVTFHSELPAHRDEERDFGLIAEEVAQVLPELVLYDDAGRPSGVRYNALSPLLLNEVQRLHRQLLFLWTLLGVALVASVTLHLRRRARA